MTGEELLTTYPKSTVVIKQWYLNKMLEGLEDENLPEDFKEHVRQQDMSDESVGKLIDSHPRGLFDVFDSHKVFIQINVNTPFFSYSINEGDVISGSWESRIGAEEAAVEQAFKMLNDKI
jgi:hypothetical protein